MRYIFTGYWEETKSAFCPPAKDQSFVEASSHLSSSNAKPWTYWKLTGR
jgi:hypothetical protein